MSIHLFSCTILISNMLLFFKCPPFHVLCTERKKVNQPTRGTLEWWILRSSESSWLFGIFSFWYCKEGGQFIKSSWKMQEQGWGCYIEIAKERGIEKNKPAFQLCGGTTLFLNSRFALHLVHHLSHCWAPDVSHFCRDEVIFFLKIPSAKFSPLHFFIVVHKIFCSSSFHTSWLLLKWSQYLK